LSGVALAKTEAKDAIPPCGNLPAVLRPALQAGPQGFLAKKGKFGRSGSARTLQGR